MFTTSSSNYQCRYHLGRIGSSEKLTSGRNKHHRPSSANRLIENAQMGCCHGMYAAELMDEEFVVYTNEASILEFLITPKSWLDIAPSGRNLVEHGETSFSLVTANRGYDIHFTNISVVDMKILSYDITIGPDFASPLTTFKVTWTFCKGSSPGSSVVRRRVFDFKHLRNPLMPYKCALVGPYDNALARENRKIMAKFPPSPNLISVKPPM